MESSRIMGGDTSDNRRSTSPSGDLQQDGDSQAQRDGTEAASKEAPLEDSSRETPSFASKEALENSSKETAMAGMETAMASMEAPDSASSGQASKHAERNLQKVLNTGLCEMRINSGKMRIKSHPVRAHNPVGQLPTAYYTAEGIPWQPAATQYPLPS